MKDKVLVLDDKLEEERKLAEKQQVISFGYYLGKVFNLPIIKK
jgi:hypothetical protein